MTRAIERSLYAQMQRAHELERTARETLSQAQSAYAAARKSYRRASAEWVNAHEQLEAQHAAAARPLAFGGAR